MLDIAKASEVSRATVFNYFSTKRAILHSWLSETFEQHRKVFESEFDQRGRLDKGLHSIMLGVASDLEKEKSFYRDIFWEVMDDSATDRYGWWSRIKEALQMYMDVWVVDDARVGEDGVVSLDDRTTEMMSGTFVITLVNWLNSEKEYSLLERLQKNLEVVWQGLRMEEVKT